MSASFQIPLDIPDIDIIAVRNGKASEFILEVKGTLDYTHCRQCQRKITAFHGYDRPIRLQHLPILERKVFIELRPKRYRCHHCEGDPTTTQTLDWYTPNSPHTKALDQWLLKMLANSTVSDVSRRCQVGYDAVEGCIERHVSQTVDWNHIPAFHTVGLDEIALRKGHQDFVCVVTALNEQDQVIVLAILPGRYKHTVKDFLDSMPAPLKQGVKRVCSDMYEGFIQAAKEALPQAAVIIDRFHVAKHYHKGVDDLRKATLRTLKQTVSDEEYTKLKGLMWPFRHHFWEVEEEQQEALAMLFLHAPELKQAWLLRHELFLIYETHGTPQQAEQRFEQWMAKARETKLTCFDRFIQCLDKSRADILAYFDGRHTSGFVEGLNNRLKLIKRRCYGLLDAGKLFQRIQIDLQERMGFFKLWPNTTSCA